MSVFAVWGVEKSAPAQRLSLRYGSRIAVFPSHKSKSSNEDANYLSIVIPILPHSVRYERSLVIDWRRSHSFRACRRGRRSAGPIGIECLSSSFICFDLNCKFATLNAVESDQHDHGGILVTPTPSWGGGGECIESNGENLQSTPFCLRRTTIHVCSLPVEGASSATTVSKLLIRRIHVRDGITHGFASYLGGVDNDRT